MVGWVEFHVFISFWVLFDLITGLCVRVCVETDFRATKVYQV